MILALILIGLIVLGMLLSIISNKLLIGFYEKRKDIPSNINISSFELLMFFITNLNLNVRVLEYSTYLDNSYNIKKKTILLSNEVFSNSSVGALSISMHELGHAVQHQTKSKLFYSYYFFKILSNITSIFIVPLLIFLIVSLFLPYLYLQIAIISLLVVYFFNLIIRIIIIPLEKNASKIALNLLKEYNIFNKKELKIAKKLLNLALLTYIGGFFRNYVQITKKILRNF